MCTACNYKIATLTSSFNEAGVLIQSGVASDEIPLNGAVLHAFCPWASIIPGAIVALEASG